MLWLLMIFKFEFAMNEEWRSFCWGKFIEITKYIRSETKKAKKPKKEENPES